ncbi:hypothetical protein P171DRAFT_252888 [Karstenula rhodostoma CBS 690.94]|uniref:Uncharacterized protein n=1 Tax=Karstenula rhodostoma CBS 690.94 TaxID=1392251 RepID=A0A9P4PLH2_9PLEO|nr:hypothetical protein P171DRAFT_252888 [Karstenula rhodostoma CBS 690.94]
MPRRTWTCRIPICMSDRRRDRTRNALSRIVCRGRPLWRCAAGQSHHSASNRGKGAAKLLRQTQSLTARPAGRRWCSHPPPSFRVAWLWHPFCVLRVAYPVSYLLGGIAVTYLAEHRARLASAPASLPRLHRTASYLSPLATRSSMIA